MELVALVSVLALLEFLAFGLMVGRARQQTGVQAPAITGDPLFERTMRSHQNTMEQLVVFLPALWIFASYVSAPIAAALGLVFVAGRGLYVRGYIQEARRRTAGAAVTALAQFALLLGGGVGALLDWL